MEKKIAGIKLVYYINKRSEGSFDVAFFISEGVPSKTFISTPEIRKAIRNYAKTSRKVFGRQMGFMDFSFDKKNNVLVSSNYQPLELNEAIFSGKGIAGTLEAIVQKRLEKKFPSIRKMRGSETNPDTRGNQLKKRGTLGNEYDFIKDRLNLKRKLRADKKKARKKKRTARRKPKIL